MESPSFQGHREFLIWKLLRPQNRHGLYGRGQTRGIFLTPPTVMASAGPPYINAAKIRELVSMREIIDAVERGLADFSSGKVTQPVRSVLEATEHGGYEVLLYIKASVFNFYSLLWAAVL